MQLGNIKAIDNLEKPPAWFHIGQEYIKSDGSPREMCPSKTRSMKTQRKYAPTKPQNKQQKAKNPI